MGLKEVAESTLVRVTDARYRDSAREAVRHDVDGNGADAGA